MKATSFLLLMLINLLIISCKPKVMNLGELRDFLNDERNGVKKTIKNESGLQIEVDMLRPELVFEASRPPKNDTLKYFRIGFSKNGREALLQTGGINVYANLIANLSYHPSQFFRLIVDKKDTVQLANSSFSNVFGTAPSNSLLLVFKAKSPQMQYEVVMDELGFNMGDLKFVFTKKDINQYNGIIIKK